MSKNISLTPDQRDELIQMRLQGYLYKDIARHFLEKYDIHKSAENIGATYRYIVKDDDRNKHAAISYVQAHRQKLRNKDLKKKERIILDHQVVNSDILESIKKNISELEIPTIPFRVEDHDSEVLEAGLTLSDLHFGLKTQSYNRLVAEERFKKICGYFIKKCEEEKPKEIIIKNLGDIIHGTSMHYGQEFTVDMQVGEQVFFAINLYWKHLYSKIVKLGIPVTSVVVAGNHDRPTRDKQLNDIGEAYLTRPIFGTLDMLCEQYDHVRFRHEIGVFHVYKNCLYIHGDHVRSLLARKGQVGEMQKRQQQTGKKIERLEHGHFHSPIITNNGEVISNGTLATGDQYSMAKGFECNRAMQAYRFEFKNGHVETGFFTTE